MKRIVPMALAAAVALMFSGCSFTLLNPEKRVEKLYLRKTKDLNATAHEQAHYSQLPQERNVTRTPPPVTAEALPVMLPHKNVPAYMAMPKEGKTSVRHFPGDKVQLAFENLPINNFMVYMLSDIFKQPYTIDEKLKKSRAKVTMDMPEPMSRDDLYRTFLSMLEMNGIVAENREGVLFLKPRGRVKAKKEEVTVSRIGFGRTLPSSWFESAKVALLVPFEYIDPNKISSMLYTLDLKGVKTRTLRKNLLLLVGNPDEVQKVLSLIEMVDQPTMRKRAPYLLTFQYIDPKTFLERMRAIFKAAGVPVAADPGNLGIIMEPIKEINALYVVSQKQEWIDMLLFWKQKLDVLQESNDTPKLFLYHVKKRKAEALAEALNKILGGATVSLDKGAADKKVTAKATNDTPKNTKPQKRQARSAARGGLRIVADAPTNTISMLATKAQYMQALPLIRELDTLPKQVIIEVTLAEVTLTDDFQFGFEWFLKKEHYALGTQDGLSLGGSGLSGLLINGDFLAKLNAYSSKKLLDIISKPRLVVLNNETGNINVGSQIPIITSEASASDLGNTTNSSILRNVTYRDTGVIVDVTPTVNSQGILTLKVKLNLSEAQTNDTSGIDSPLIVKRSLTTSAVLRSGETIFLGGLIATNNSDTNEGVPYIERLPVINWFFSTQSKKKTKTELIMLITPTIVDSSDIIVEETAKFNALLKSIQFYHGTQALQ